VKRSREKSGKKPAPSTKVLATRIKKLENTIETNYRDYYNNTTDPLYSSGGVPIIISVIPQGDDFNQRKGEQVTLTKVKVRLSLTNPISTTSVQFRVLIFWDLQTNGLGFFPWASVSFTDGLIDDNTITNPLIAPLNERAAQRYKVLIDKIIVINPDSSATTKNLVFQKTFSLSNAKQLFATSAGNIAAIPSRSINLFFYSNKTAVQQTAIRLWYKDA
jgi:hypothetical protein